jgi:HSP20 family protein
VALVPKRREREGILSPLLELRHEMDDLFSDFFGRFPAFRGEFGLAPSFPTMDIKETDTAVEVVAEVPGVRGEDLDLSVVGDTLTIKGEKKEEKEEKGKSMYRVERRYGRFERSVALPAEVNVDKAEAHYKDGILKISLPKKEPSAVKVRQIPVK